MDENRIARTRARPTKFPLGTSISHSRSCNVAVNVHFSDGRIRRIDQQWIDDGVSRRAGVGKSEPTIAEQQNGIRGGRVVSRLVARQIGKDVSIGKILNVIGEGQDLNRMVADQLRDPSLKIGSTPKSGSARAWGEIDHCGDSFRRMQFKGRSAGGRCDQQKAHEREPEAHFADEQDDSRDGGERDADGEELGMGEYHR